MTTATVAPPTEREPELLRQTVVVIGGSAGIGLETARLARTEGADVILTGRNPDRLDRAAAEVGALRSAAFDATDQDALDRFLEELPTPIDHVMVTAGRPYYALLADIDIEQARRSLDEHLWLPIAVARHAVNSVRPGGTLLFVSGTGARRAVRERHRCPPAGPRPGDHRHGHRSAPRPDRQPGARIGAGPGQPHRPRLRRHSVVRVAARR
jgi:NAD(P)-dependent dehydrogenase (short-subunit alcohol dehydrogenase family)